MKESGISGKSSAPSELMHITDIDHRIRKLQAEKIRRLNRKLANFELQLSMLENRVFDLSNQKRKLLEVVERSKSHCAVLGREDSRWLVDYILTKIIDLDIS